MILEIICFFVLSIEVYAVSFLVKDAYQIWRGKIVF